jgi:hypothetical protein
MQREGRHIITSGSSATINNGAGTVYLDFSSTAATFALTMPSTPSDQDIIEIIPGGTLTSGVVVTLFTLSANTGQSIIGTALSAVALNIGTALRYVYRASNSAFYRIQ